MKTVVNVFAASLVLLSLATAGVSATRETGRDQSADSEKNEPMQCVEFLEFTIVQDAVELDENQKKAIAEINKTLKDSAPDSDTVSKLPANQRETVLHEWKTKAEQLKKKIGESLNAEQLRRLKEIALQLGLKMHAGAILAEQSLVKELSLTPQQKESLEKLHQSFQQQVNTARETLMKAGEKGGEITEDQAARFRDEYRRLRDETYEKAVGLLTPAQKQKLSELKGKIADIDVERMLAEQSQRLEKWTKHLRKETLGREKKGETAPKDESGQENPYGTGKEDTQTKP